MTQDSAEPSNLTDAAKAALLDSGVIPKLKHTLFPNAAPKDNDAQELIAKAEAAVEDLQQLVDSGNLDDADKQKLNSVLSRLRGALQGSSISREALSTALSEATGAIASVGGNAKDLTVQQKTEQLWREIEQHNNAIDDDFKKMHEMGIIFDKKLWDKHNQLSEYMLAHPQDIEKQKELNAVDDQLLQQVEGQLAKHPQARPAFDHAKKESEERHQKVDHKLAAIEQNQAYINSAWDTPDIQENASAPKAELQNVTLNDVETQHIGQKPKNKAIVISSYGLFASYLPIKIFQIFVYMQTKVCLRTKLAHGHGILLFIAIVKAFTIKPYNDSIFLVHNLPARKSVQM